MVHILRKARDVFIRTNGRWSDVAQRTEEQESNKKLKRQVTVE